MGIFDAVASFFGSQSASDDVNKQIRAQREAQQSQNQWQSAENDRDRMWQQQQWLEQFQKQNDEWLHRFNLENEYNSPQAQVARLKAAGINPAALGGSGGLASAGEASDPSVGTPGQFPSHTVSPLGIQNPNGVSSSAQMFSSLAQMLDSLTKVGHLGLDTKRQNTLLAAELDRLIAGTQNEQEQAAWTGLKSKLISSNADKMISTWLNKMNKEADLAAANGDLAKVEQQYKEALTHLYNTKDKALQKVLPEIKPYFDSIFEVKKSEAIKNKAQATEHYAGANLKNEEASTVSSLREGQVTAQEYANEIARWNSKAAKEDFKEQIATQPERIHAIIASARQADIITATMAADLKSAMARGDYAELREFLGALGDAVGSFASASNAGSMRLNALNGSERNDISRRFQQAYDRRTLEMRRRRVHDSKQDNRGQK